jgi:hypothetical protein
MNLYWIAHCGGLAIEIEGSMVTTEHFTDGRKYRARLKQIERIHETDHDRVESYQTGEVDLSGAVKTSKPFVAATKAILDLVQWADSTGHSIHPCWKRARKIITQSKGV